jgi:hypothetical protein
LLEAILKVCSIIFHVETMKCYRELLKSSLFVLFSRNQLRNSVLQKSSLFGFPQAECRICDDVLFLTHYFANVAFRLVFA